MTTATISVPGIARPRMSHARQAFLSLFWLGIESHWAAILLITLPRQAALIGGHAIKGETLGIVLIRRVRKVR